MKKIKFELIEENNISFLDNQHVIADISLNGDTISDYLQAFKAFLIACSFTEETISEITTKEQAFLDFQEDFKDLTIHT